MSPSSSSVKNYICRVYGVQGLGNRLPFGVLVARLGSHWDPCLNPKSDIHVWRGSNSDPDFSKYFGVPPAAIEARLLTYIMGYRLLP